MQEVVFLLWEIYSIETGEGQGGRRKKAGSAEAEAYSVDLL